MPLPMTVSAKLQSDQASVPPRPPRPSESRLPISPTINPPMMLKALIRTASVKVGVGILRLRMRMITDDTTEVLFSLRLLDRAADHAYCL